MIDAEVQEIRQAFAIEGAELLVEMETALLALEADPGSEDDFNRLFRAVHTIKGSASIVRFEAIELFCHDVEHLLARIRDRECALDHQLIRLLLKCHDHISTMLSLYCAAPDDQISVPAPHATLLDQLHDWTGSVIPSATKYGQLDESYLDDISDGAGGGLHLFDEPDEAEVTVKPALPVDGRETPEENSAARRVVRIDAARLDQLSDLVVELVTAASVLEARVRTLGDLASAEAATHVGDLIKKMQEKTMSFRMVPVQTLFGRFQRIVSDGGAATGKKIRLQIQGGDTELDKAVAEKLHEPLLHLVRNAIDHGLETEQERDAAGKPLTGTVTLSAIHDSGMIIIRVSDDGRGINRDQVARKAVERGLASYDSLPTGDGVLSYIFEPGFSTRDDATMMSGRGVGMDVVRKAVESLRGIIDVKTGEGTGTTFSISIPLSLSLVDGFMVSLAGTLYILPMEQILETLELPGESQRAIMPEGCLQVREQLYPCLELRKILGVTDAPPAVQHVVIFRCGGRSVGLVVDCLLGEIKTVVKPLGQLYRSVTCISGASILGDGSIALILETTRLVEVARATRVGS